jgi:hypothetical protein
LQSERIFSTTAVEKNNILYNYYVFGYCQSSCFYLKHVSETGLCLRF